MSASHADTASTSGSSDGPLWYKEAVIYELHVRAFADSNADGIGDFRGLSGKLDYLQDLGATALWLLPFYPSPLRDDGYDIANYTDVHPSYGTLDDFKRFLHEAKKRQLRVITELPLNHTSSDHPWFQRARRAEAKSAERDFYVWTDSPQRYADARVIFTDFEKSNWTWDPLAAAYYWHRFYAHQPDLNYDNPAVQRAILDVVDFWLGLGVDGLRLDAVPYLFEQEGTTCENLPQTHEFLRRLRAHIDERFGERMLLAEANQWPEDAAPYFGQGDECHMSFHFPLMPRMFMAAQMESSYPITDIVAQTPQIPSNCQWALFLRNHDELTLEMVTDEDRDFMYSVYAQDKLARINLGIRRRLAPLLQSRPLIELMNGLLMSLPGTPVLYYGDEIGMGDNVYLGDRNGVRTPMQWSGDRNAGFSQANPQSLFLPPIIDPMYHYETVNVEAQQGSTSSLLWWMKRLIGLRKQYPLFGHGSLTFLRSNNSKVLAFMRELEGQQVVVVANLSRHAQFAELDLERFDGATPIELFGRTVFPTIGRLPYLLTLSPHAFFWFELISPEEPTAAAAETDARLQLSAPSWTEVLEPGYTQERRLQRALGHYLERQRWYRSKARKQSGIEIEGVLPLTVDERREGRIALIRVSYSEGADERYVLPLLWTISDVADQWDEQRRRSIIAQLELDHATDHAHRGVLHDALIEPEMGLALLGLFERTAGPLASGALQLLASGDVSLAPRAEGANEPPTARVLGAEQSNTSIVLGDELIMKIFRRLDEGVNPELEVGRVLTKQGFDHTPGVLGALELHRPRAEGARSEANEPATLAIVQRFIANQGDAWKMTLDVLHRTYESLLGRLAGGQAGAVVSPPPGPGSWQHRLGDELQLPPGLTEQLLGPYQRQAELLATRTAEMHLALAAEHEEMAFAPEAVTPMHQRSLYQAARTRMLRTLELLQQQGPRLDEAASADAQRIMQRQQKIDGQLRRMIDTPIRSVRTRIHGDYHLGQVLYTGEDFAIIDFEGEPARPLNERRYKASPLRDVAGMLRSFHYAAISALEALSSRDADTRALGPWAQCWQSWTSTVFVRTYLQRCGDSAFIPQRRDQLETMLQFYLLDKCIYEAAYELNNRPGWASVPLAGLVELTA